MNKFFNKGLLFVSISSMALFNKQLFAQVNNYIFTQTNSAYTAITGGTVIVEADNITTSDDELYQLNDIGFDFVFNGTTYNNFGISSNGFIWFGTGVPDAFTYLPISDPSANLNGAGTIEGVISPLGNDLIKRLDSPFGDIMVRTAGDAPARICTIQFSNWSSVNGGANTIYNFQIKLYETTNQIAFVYSGFNTDVFVSGFQVGLRGFDNTDYKNISGTTNNWSGVAIGSSDATSSIVSSTILPSDGTTFLWTPGASSLPLNLTQFSASREGSVNRIRWATANEYGIKSFVVERSNNGKDFQPIGNLSAANNPTGSSYSFKDLSPEPGVNYYRLKIEETSGTTKFTLVKVIRNNGNANVKLYPNPATSAVTIELISAIADKATISVIAANGKVLYQRNNYSISRGTNKLILPAEGLVKGVYLVKVLLENDLVVLRFIKQ